MIGTALSHYEVLDKLGQGGMGEVFLARDTSLDRKVAIKFLPPGVATDHETVARFSREARVLASLNHPNIAAVHGLEQHVGRPFIVMEFAEGETLERKIARGRLPLREAIEICRQIAEGLEAAQEKGIVHRDLKPSNVMVASDGRVKLLDFGLAKALEAVPVEDATTLLTREVTVTGEGLILGTAPYMSPEQASGKPLDARTDIWSFGCVLYEVLTGKRAFTGSTTTELLARILEREPDWSQLPETVSFNVKCLLRRCLQKDPHARLHNIGDARIELEDTLAGRVGPVAAAPAKAPRRVLAFAALAGLLLGVVIVGTWAFTTRAPATAAPVVRFGIDLPPDQPLKPTWNGQLTFSPDGDTLAYSHSTATGDTTSFRRLRDLNARPLEAAASLTIPVFTPDARYVVLMDPMASALKKAALTGGAPLPFANYDMAFRGDWGNDGFYYWTAHYFGPIVRTPEAGGDPQPVTALDLAKQERTHRHVQVLPGGKAILFTVSTGGISTFDDARIDLYNLATKTRKTLVQGGFSPRYSPSGHIVYARGGALYAVPFDPDRLEVTDSRPVKVVDGVFMSTNSGSAHFDISRNGSLAYAEGKAEGGRRTLVWVDRQGKATTQGLPSEPRSYLFPRIAPDGQRIAFEIEGVNHDLYVYEPDRDIEMPMTTDGVSHAPVWTPDGQRLAFRSWKAGTMTMWWMPADRSGPEERLTHVGARQSVVSFSPDGHYVAYNQMEAMRGNSGDMGMGGAMESGGTGIWVLPMRGDRTPRRFASSKFMQGSGRFSPDGRWVAYCTNEGDGNQVYVRAWPGPGGLTKVSSEGGTDPVWSPDGRELFYRNGDKMMVVAVLSTQPTFKASKPVQLWQGRYSHGMSSSCGPPGTSEGNYDVSRDGRFLMIKDVDEDATSRRIVVVLNFAAELKALTAEQKR